MTQAASTTSVVQEAIDHYDQLLRDAKITSNDYKVFQDAIIDAKITFGGRSSCPYLRPCFVGADQWDHVKKVSVLVNQAMDKAGEVLQQNQELYDMLCLTDGEKQLIARCAFADFGTMAAALEARGIQPVSTEHEYVAQNLTELPDDKANEVMELVAALEGDDDVQNVYTNLG